jgi:hypothetical protein
VCSSARVPKVESRFIVPLRALGNNRHAENWWFPDILEDPCIRRWPRTIEVPPEAPTREPKAEDERHHEGVAAKIMWCPAQRSRHEGPGSEPSAT